MNTSTQKWFTCTPIHLPGDYTRHFTRDTGLLCKGFQQIGIPCKNIMPLPYVDGDQREDLLRTEYSNLEDPAWWRSLGGHGVVLYAWGMPKYIPIAKAIKEAGLTLVSSIDASGLISPYTSLLGYARINYGKRIANHGLLLGSMIATASMAKALLPSLSDKARLHHLDLADVITMVTPQATEIMKALAIRFGYPQVAPRVHYAPHPQLSDYHYDASPKENIVLTVGRWDHKAWFQKQPDLLVSAAAKFLAARPDYRHLIVGGHVECLQPLIDKYGQGVADRIELIPFIQPEELKAIFCKTKISYWSSRHEGQQNTGAQALCCGSSVVSTNGLTMSCFAHYASRASGRQAIRNTPQCLADALVMEAAAWDEGHRDPTAISATWCREFHADRVAQRMLDLVGHGS